MKSKNLYFFLFFFFLVCPVWAQIPFNVKLDQFFDKLAEKNKAMGTLTLTKNGKTIYSRSIGYSHIEGNEPADLTAASKYRIGSVTKMFTAVLIFQLNEEGKLKLTDPLSNFFPQVQNASSISIEQILAHRGGIHEVTNDPDFKNLRTKLVSKADMLAFIARSTPDFEPGTKYAYSSAGYFLLGCIAEKLSGKSYAELLQQSITAKLGLNATYPATGNIDPGRNESFSYKYVRNWEQQIETNPSLLFGAGSMISTSADMAKFIYALFDYQLVSQQNLNLMMQQQLGMESFNYDEKIAYGHTGGIDGFGSWLIVLPGEKLVVSYAANGKVYPVKDIIAGILAIYWNQPFSIPNFESIAVSPEILMQYTGVYTIAGAPVKFTVSTANAKLYLQMNAQSAIPLEAVSADQFKIESAGMEISFDIAKKQMILKRGGGEKVFTKSN